MASGEKLPDIEARYTRIRNGGKPEVETSGTALKCPVCKKTSEPLHLTIGATHLKGCSNCGVVSIQLPSREALRSAEGTASSGSGEKVKEIFGKLDKLRGYRPPKRRAEAASIIRMLKTYTPDDIIGAWQQLKADKFWQNKELFMMTVESQIGAILKNGTRQQNPRTVKKPEEYTEPDELRHG